MSVAILAVVVAFVVLLVVGMLLVDRDRASSGMRTVRRRRRQPGDTGRAVRLLARFTRGYHGTFLVALLMLVFEAAAAVFEAYPLAYLIDYLQGDAGAIGVPWIGSELIATVAVLTAAIVAITAINSLADSLAEIYLARGGRALGFQLRGALFGHLQRLPLAYHDRRQTGDVITRVIGDVKEVEEFVIASLSDIAGSALLLIGTVGFLLVNSWQVSAVAVAIVPVLAIVSTYFSRRIKAAAKAQRASEGELASATQEMLTSIRIVQAFGRAGRDASRFDVESGRAMDAALRGARLEAWFGWVMSVLEAVTIAAVIWLGLWLMQGGLITVGMLVLFTILIGRMFKPTRKIVKEWNTIAKVYASVERVADLLDREVTVRDEPGAVPAPPLRGGIEFRNVTFAYQTDGDAGPGTRIGSRGHALRDVTFSISPGEVVALVGPSGAGKSTIAQLVPRFYDPQVGQVLVDGNDVRGFTLDSLRAQVSMVLQETILVSGTVAENIGYGRTDATREEIVAAAIQANAHEFIIQLPDGYDTELSERAANLSGGQRQRISIARAFVRNSPILILDEPTTGLDAQATQLVLDALRALMTHKTTIVISHDPDLISGADRILAMDDGRIVESRTPAPLTAAGGRDAAASSGGSAGKMRRSRGASAAPARRRRQPVPMSVTSPDPLGASELIRQLPGLETALDATRMQATLQDRLLGNGTSDWHIERCVPGKKLYTPGAGCLVRYDVEIRHRESGASRHAIVSGRVFEDSATSRAFLDERLAPLAALGRERDELVPFTKPVGLVDELAMVAYAFPIDAELPGLLTATDPTEMLDLLRTSTPVTADGGTAVDECRVALEHYPRRQRCVLRYEVAGHVDANRPSARRDAVQRSFHGKVSADPDDATVPALRALHDRLAEGDLDYPVRVPRLVAARPDLGLTVMETLPGAARVAQLVELAARGAAPATDLLDATEACAGAIAALHASGVSVGARRDLGDELTYVADGAAAIAPVSPAVAERLMTWHEQLALRSGDVDPLPAVFCHGDYNHKQVLFDNGSVGLLDFDGACVAEPALDVGHFSAYLRLGLRKAGAKAVEGSAGPADSLVERFIDAYAAAAGVSRKVRERLQARSQLYEAATLLRIAVHSWQQLKPARLAMATELLDERMAHLQTSGR